MKSAIRIIGLSFLTLCLATFVQAQTSSSPAAKSSTTSTTAVTTTSSDKTAVAGATNSARTDCYTVHFTHAAPGKVAELGESLKTPAPNGPQPGHEVILRHQYGDAWDYVLISHYGTKMTVDAARPQVPASQRDLSDWHNDTIVNGPPWSEFSKALGLGDDAKKTANAVYVVSFYRAAPGQRDAAEKNLATPPDPANDKAAGTILMQHLEGSPWHFLGVVRYNSWQDVAASQALSVPQTSKKDSPWSQMRDTIVYHTDTLCDRLQ
jgi:hypothetical protein